MGEGERDRTMRLLIYSHDTFGMGNIRRMHAISRGLLEWFPQSSVLLVTGSPVIHSLRPECLPRMDYVKLPCLTRTDRGEYSARYLDTSAAELIRLRSELILATVTNFAPDVLIVDKKPRGVSGELGPTLDYLRSKSKRARTVLVLRDILDRPEAIISNWERHGHFRSLPLDYDRILVLGQQEIFDPLVEYHFPAEATRKTRFCGYLRKDADLTSAAAERRKLGITGDHQRLLLITPGGGEDGSRMIEVSLAALAQNYPADLRTVVVCGPAMPPGERERLRTMAEGLPAVSFLDFTSDMITLMAAADLIVSMAGYNTICEILSLRRKAIVIPRVTPTEEQLLRVERIASRGCFTAIHPDDLTPELMSGEIWRQLNSPADETAWTRVDLGAQTVINAEVEALLANHE